MLNGSYAKVRTAMANTVWLQADVTANDEVDQALQKHFGIVGPPSIMFYGLDGVERRNMRVVGFMKPAEFDTFLRGDIEKWAKVMQTAGIKPGQ